MTEPEPNGSWPAKPVLRWVVGVVVCLTLGAATVALAAPRWSDRGPAPAPVDAGTVATASGPLDAERGRPTGAERNGSPQPPPRGTAESVHPAVMEGGDPRSSAGPPPDGIELEVPPPEGPLGPLADRLPANAVELVNRIIAEGDSGVIKVEADGVRFSPGGLVPRRRQDMADLRGGFYEITILRLPH